MKTATVHKLQNLSAGATAATGWMFVGVMVALMFKRLPATVFCWSAALVSALMLANWVIGQTYLFDKAERTRRDERKTRAKTPLPEWAHLGADRPDDVWVITETYGHHQWKLYAPGTAANLAALSDPASYFPAHDGPGRNPMTDGGEPFTLAEMQQWAQPWIERVAEGHITDWAYGPDRKAKGESALFARVTRGA